MPWRPGCRAAWSVPWAHCGREGMYSHLPGRHWKPVVSVAVGTPGGRPVAVSAAADGISADGTCRTREPVGSPIRVESGLSAVAVSELRGRPVAVSCGDDQDPARLGPGVAAARRRPAPRPHPQRPEGRCRRTRRTRRGSVVRRRRDRPRVGPGVAAAHRRPSGSP